MIASAHKLHILQLKAIQIYDEAVDSGTPHYTSLSLLDPAFQILKYEKFKH